MSLHNDQQEVYDKLTEKQKRFVDLWTGDAKETAGLVGYSNPMQAGSRVLENVDICRLIKAKRDAELKPEIADRKERQKFWSDVLKGEVKTKAVTKEGVEVDITPAMKDRLKASELLGKSEGDFIDRLKIEPEEIVKSILESLPQDIRVKIKEKVMKKLG